MIIVLLSNILSIFYTSLYCHAVQPCSVSQTSSVHEHTAKKVPLCHMPNCCKTVPFEQRGFSLAGREYKSI